MYGIDVAALDILVTFLVAFTFDWYGLICHKVKRISEKSCLTGFILAPIEALNATGNTTFAIGKAFPIGSAALYSIALFTVLCLVLKDNISLFYCLLNYQY